MATTLLRCPGCHQPAGFWKYKFPVEEVKQGKQRLWATAAPHEVDHGHFRCGGCVHLAAREGVREGKA